MEYTIYLEGYIKIIKYRYGIKRRRQENHTFGAAVFKILPATTEEIGSIINGRVPLVASTSSSKSIDNKALFT